MRYAQAQRLYAGIVYGVLCLIAILMFVTQTGCTFGPKGDQGPAGESPNIRTKPADSIECLNGGVEITINGVTTVICNGQDGSNGPQGPQGPQGPAGSPGVPGTPGTQVTLVKFCPGTPTYPTTFPEYGLCIYNNLYGVYSANNGFLTLLPPGTYLSVAIGSSCTFVIAANCQVIN